MAKRKKKVNILGIFIDVLVCLMLLNIAIFAFFKTIGAKYVPASVTSTYVTEVTNPLTGEKLPFIQANVFANKNKKGTSVAEVVFNSYSGVDKQAIYSRGFQVVTDANGKQTLYAYDSYDGVTFATLHEYEQGDPFITDIDGVTYKVVLDGTYEEEYTNWAKTLISGAYTAGPALNVGGLAINFVWNWIEKGEPGLSTTSTREVEYTMTDFVNAMAKLVSTSSAGTGDAVIGLADIGDYLHIYEKDSSVPVGNNTFINSYFTVNTHYDLRGMTRAQQSMFGAVANNAEYNTSGIEDEQDYWKDTTVLTLTEIDFTKRTDNDKVYLTIDLNKVLSLSNYENLEVEVILNIDNVDGLDHYGLCGLETITKLTLVASEVKDFELLNGALKDTSVIASDIICTNVNLIILEV